MSKLKIGDRVCIYGMYQRYENDTRGAGGCFGVKGIITGDAGGASGILEVENGDGCRMLVHPKQCRRLVRKERRRVWLTPAGHSKQKGPLWQQTTADDRDAVEFVEARKK